MKKRKFYEIHAEEERNKGQIHHSRELLEKMLEWQDKFRGQREDGAVKKKEVSEPLVAVHIKVRRPGLSVLVGRPLVQAQCSTIPLKQSQFHGHTHPDPAVPIREICSTDVTTLYNKTSGQG